MKEIEVLVEVYDDIEKAKSILNRFQYIGEKQVIDEYYYDPKRDELKPDKDGEIYKCLRLRKKNDEFLVTYKDDVFEDNKWLYSNEYETKIESIDTSFIKDTVDAVKKFGVKHLDRNIVK